jgi:hypothetical protein
LLVKRRILNVIKMHGTIKKPSVVLDI